MSCGCGCFGAPQGCADRKKKEQACIAMMDAMLRSSPPYQEMQNRLRRRPVRFGDDGPESDEPPHADDFWVSQADAVEYVEWLDKRVRKFEKAFNWWQGGADKPQPANIEVAGKAAVWANGPGNVGWAEGKSWLQWVAEVWNPFVNKMRTGSWLPFGTTWTRLNSWDVIQRHHRELKDGERRAKELGLPDVPGAGNPDPKGPLDKPLTVATDLLNTAIWVGVGVGAFLVFKEVRRK